MNLNTRPLVSVVIPFFNRIEFTLRAVRSVFAQTYSNIEIIVVNDGSTEDDSRLIDLFSTRNDLTYIRLRDNAGPAGARNIGINASKGRFVAFLDSDDTWEAEKLHIQIDEMLKNGWSFSHTSYYRHDTRNGQIETVRSGLRRYTFPWPAFHCLIATPSVVMDRRLLCGVSFRSDLRFAEDTLLWLALSKSTTLHGIDAPLTNVFIGDLTTALDDSKSDEAWRLLAKHGLAGHRALLAVHAFYRIARKLHRKIRRRLC